MQKITNIMINMYNLKDIDFMGYSFNRYNASFHHLIVPKRSGGLKVIENGAILNANTSHPYLHIIECLDLDTFNYVTSEMIDINIKGYLDYENLRNIDEILSEFEAKHFNDRSKKGKRLIKEEYTRRIKV